MEQRNAEKKPSRKRDGAETSGRAGNGAKTPGRAGNGAKAGNRKSGTAAPLKRVDGAFGLKKKEAPAPKKKPSAKKTVPPAGPKPLLREDGTPDVREAVLETVCGVTSSLPGNTLPEIAFAGKSNVGKSSLLNALVNRKALARTSAQPGKTQTINFYRVNGVVYFVDLPGYGFANASESARIAWGKMIENYLHRSEQLKTVFLLVDIRHTPSENDRMMYDWIADQGLRAVVIATKSDKVTRNQLAGRVKDIRAGLGCPDETPVIPFSSETKAGRNEIFAEIVRSM